MPFGLVAVEVYSFIWIGPGTGFKSLLLNMGGV